MTVRRKKKGRAWKGFVAGMGLAGIFGLLLMWAAAGPSGAKIRDAIRSRMSVMVDRADQLVEAWNRRTLPGKPDQETPALAPPASELPDGRRASTPVPTPAPISERPVLAPDQPAPPPPAVAAPPPPDKGITPDDQKQLRELMKKINQGH